jgi:hypothetical protein
MTRRLADWQKKSLIIEWAGYTAWPEARRTTFEPCRFRQSSADTVNLLKEECARMRARDVRVLVDAPAHAFRKDGQLAAGVRLGYPGVIVQLRTDERGMLTFPCDTYGDHWDNLRAVGLTLERLRDIERYGAARSRQYQGFAALPAMGLSTTTITVTDAVDVLERYSSYDAVQIIQRQETAQAAVEQARVSTHPDRNDGEREEWDAVQLAAERLSAHFGVAL